MIEILHPNTDRAAIDDLRRHYDYVDGWAAAYPELAELDAFGAGPTVDPANLDAHSRYVTYPWRSTIVRLPEPAVFHRLRTARNRCLITDAEQELWSQATIAVAGLSVGASLLHACSLTGARRFRIADPDALGLTNLNRLAGSVCDLGVPKAVLAQRRLLETDPYATIETSASGYTPDDAPAFFGDTGPRTDVVLEEVDDLAMKVAIRREARRRRIPVVMVTDSGDGVIVDVERYDLDPTYPLFGGRAGDIDLLTPEEIGDPARRLDLVRAIVGDDVGPRVIHALTEVGRTMPSWPQLGTAATIAGGVGAFVARQIVVGAQVPSGRWLVDPEAIHANLGSRPTPPRRRAKVETVHRRTQVPIPAVTPAAGPGFH